MPRSVQKATAPDPSDEICLAPLYTPDRRTKLFEFDLLYTKRVRLKIVVKSRMEKMKVMKQGRFDCFFGHDCIDLPQPAMCLRGGGADAKRKEARKRKFGHLPNQHSHGDETTGTAIGEHDTEPPVKRQERKRLKSESEGPKPLPASAEARDLVDEQSSAQSAERETFEKKQRFIIFIGMYAVKGATDMVLPQNPCYMLTLARQSSLHHHNGFYNSALCKGTA